MTIIDKITSRSEDYKEQYDNELIDYIKNFDGTEKHYLIEQIQILEGAKFYLMSGFYQKSFEENYKHLDLKAIASAIDKENKLFPKKLRNSLESKIAFLYGKKSNQGDTTTPHDLLGEFKGKMSFSSNNDLMELGHALIENGNWTGTLIEICKLLGDLSGKEIPNPSSYTTALFNRDEPKLIPALLTKINLKHKK